MSGVREGIGRVDAALARPVSLRALALLRVLVGPIVLLHLEPFLRSAADGRIYRDSFYEPYADWYPELPRGVYVAVLVTGAIAAVLMTIGVLSRIATVVAFAVVTYNVFLSTTHLHNNRAYLIIVLGVLAMTPAGKERSGPAWPLLLMRFESSMVYVASGVSKLTDPDWFGGTVTYGRMIHTRDRIEAAGMPDWFVSFVTDRGVHTYAAKMIVLTELFIGIGLWFPRTRLAAVWIAVWFHVMIEVTASVDIFSYLAVAVLVVWAVPSVRDRTLELDPANPAHRALKVCVRGLDWLARFRIVPTARGAPVALVDRDGTVMTGGAAVVGALSRLPVTAMAALPIARWARSGRRARIVA